LIVPGLNNSGPQHWQSLWETLYSGCERVQQQRWDRPDLAVWSKQLDSSLRQKKQPTLIVAHSFGCLTTVFNASRVDQHVLGALLVAPANPDKFGVTDQVAPVRLPFPSILVGSSNDPWMKLDDARHWAMVWGSQFVNAGALGHINAESGLGYWRYGLSLLQQLAQQVRLVHSAI
jgi:predicted alpha/beta hydrolase family esterase